ncbi:4Fe-4S binding protein [Methanocaldococcus sp. 10A]
MILELLPYKKSNGRVKNLGILRYFVFLSSFGVVFYFWSNGYNIYGFGDRELLWFVSSLSIYYILGIIFAFIFKDNRAFCKYLCPIPIIQKIFGRFCII